MLFGTWEAPGWAVSSTRACPSSLSLQSCILRFLTLRHEANGPEIDNKVSYVFCRRTLVYVFHCGEEGKKTSRGPQIVTGKCGCWSVFPGNLAFFYKDTNKSLILPTKQSFSKKNRCEDTLARCLCLNPECSHSKMEEEEEREEEVRKEEKEEEEKEEKEEKRITSNRTTTTPGPSGDCPSGKQECVSYAHGTQR